MQKNIFFPSLVLLLIPLSVYGGDDLTAALSLPADNVGHPAVSASAPVAPTPTAAADSADSVMEQGKTLYDNGQYVAALDKFMRVLRRDPRNPEAREYLRLVVDQMRAQKQAGRDRSAAAGLANPNQPPPREIDMEGAPIPARPVVPAAMSDEDARQKVRQRQLLSLDLSVIPGVKVVSDGLQTQVEIDTMLLFTDKTGGLREEGIPILDRVSAWLKTFGQQPVFIHCYPEELQEAQLGGGSLFLHRYAQLYGFFVDERKMPATRFINTEMARPQTSDTVQISTTTSRIVIGSTGGAPLGDDGGPRPPKWLEFSITSSRAKFNPEDGEWASIDLAALSRKGLKTWVFRILDSRSRPVLSVDGKGNLLKRISWDGRNEKSGSFMDSGNYLCRLQATDSEGSNMTHDITLQIQRSGASAPAPQLTQKPKPAPARHPKPKSTPKPVAAAPAGLAAAAMAAPTTGAKTVASAKTAPPAVKPPVAAVVPEPAPAPVAEAASQETAEAPAESSDSSAIWKQVIQFDANESDLKPTLKASLERIGKTLEVYPLQKVRITGFADSGETNSANLAKQRASIVRDTLVNEYQVSAKRVIIAGGQVGAASGSHTMAKVEISITN